MPRDMTVLNDSGRFYLARYVVERVPSLGARTAHLTQFARDKLVEHRHHSRHLWMARRHLMGTQG